MSGAGMTAAFTGDHWIESAAWRWPQPDDADQRAVAGEAIAGLFAFAAGWIEPLLLEARLGCYDPEVLGEALDGAAPAASHLMLVRDPPPAGVGLEGGYAEPQVRRAPQLDLEQVQGWLTGGLDQPCAGAGRETCLLELHVRSLAVALPWSWRGQDPLVLEDAVDNRLTLPIDRRFAASWVSGPLAGRSMRPPLEVAVTSEYRELRLAVRVYWSPWAGEVDRPDSELARAAARLEARGWQRDDGP